MRAIIARRSPTGFGTVTAMKVEMSVMDFLDRAATVYRDRVAVVDEPDQPAPGWGELTFAELAGRAARPRGRASTRWASAPASGWRWCRTTRPAC